MGKRIGYLGVGIMGSGIVIHLMKGGFPVTVLAHTNREPIERVKAEGAEEADDLAALVGASDIIMMTLPGSPEVEDVVAGDGGLLGLVRSGQVVVDLSTSYPESTRCLGKSLAEKGVEMLDAPLTGSKPQAETGTLNVMCGGKKDIYDAVKPCFDAIATNVFHVGPLGSGHAVKLINNFLGQLSVAGFSEGLMLAQKYGVDLQSLFDVVTVSGGNSKSFEGTVPQVLARDFDVRFRLKHAHKDVTYTTRLGREMGIPMPMAGALYTAYTMAVSSGLGDENYSAFIKFYEKMLGMQIGKA